jgi:branched-chain amino acid transport system substrate-binding protein
MSVRELRGELERAAARTGPGPLRGAVLAELAVAEARAGEEAAARSTAREALEADSRATDRERARSVLEGGVAPRRGPVRLGLLLPLSGRFSTVSERIREGVELALRSGTVEGGPAVQLVTEDAEAPGSALRRRVASLEEQGVVAILGPVRSGRLAEVAGARSHRGLLVLSPTATRVETAAPSVLTLWAHLRREVDAALALGRWLGGTLEGSAVGAVFPDEETGRRAFLAFRRALGGTGAWMAVSSPYAPDATTLEEPIASVAAFEPRAVFAPGGETASILQMAPQLSYYGIRGAVVAGGPAWSAPSTVRRLEPSFSQYRVLPTFVDRVQGRWSEFQASYEKTYRKSLHDNMLPALGHDAALLVLTALRDVSPPRPRAVARRVAALEGVEGASGRLTPDPSTGTVARRVILRSLRDRELAPVTRAEVRSWLASAGRLETVRVRTRRRRALQAVEASGIALEPGSGG